MKKTTIKAFIFTVTAVFIVFVLIQVQQINESFVVIDGCFRNNKNYFSFTNVISLSVLKL